MSSTGFFRVTRISGTHDEYKVEHNCNGNIGWCDTQTVDGATARLLEFALEEGKRQRAKQIRDLLGII